MDQQVKDSLKKLTRFFDHPKAGTWERIDLDIRRNRMGWGRLWLQDGRGNALKHRQINLRQTSHDFRFGCNAFKLKDFEEKASQASLFILCSPHNPLGIVWEQKDLERMFSICKKYSVPVVSDEIHSDLVFHGKKHIPSALVDPDVITCISCTKTFNLAGLQACTVVFSDARQKEVFDRYWAKMDIHRNNAFSLIAMETALNEGEEWLDQLLAYLSDNIDFVVDYCREHIPSIKPMRPDATYLVWLDCRDLYLNQEELNTFFIQEARLGLNNGGDFERGLEGYMRLNVACPRSVLKQAMKQLEKAVNRRNERK